MTLSAHLVRQRAHAARLLLFLAIGCTPIPPIVAWAVGNHVAPVLLGAVLTSASGLGLGLFGPSNRRLGACLALIGQSLLLVAAFADHPWQMDSHLLIVAALIAAGTVVDRRAVVLSILVIVLHHLLLLAMAPKLAYSGTDVLLNLERLVFHVAAVGIAGGTLLIMISERLRLDRESSRQRDGLRAALAKANAAEAEAKSAQLEAQAERAAAEAAATRAADALRAHEEESAARKALQDQASSLQTQHLARLKAQRGQQDAAVAALREAISQLAQGDLTVALDRSLGGEYEDLRKDFNNAVATLHRTLVGIGTHTALIRGESDDIATSAVDLSRRTEQQAQTLEGLSRSMNQLSELVTSAATDAQEAEKDVTSTRDQATNTAAIMDRAIAAMAEIETSSAEVRKITTVIDDIAFQTNLLALNAGVEAARAGHAGRGFAVVASEVRALARRSSDAASRINGLIEQSAKQIHDGVDLVRDTGAALQTIIGSVGNASDRMGQIAATSAEQADGISDVSRALRDLDVVAQKNAAMFEETTAACQTLNRSAHALSQSLEGFRHADGLFCEVDATAAA